jgi:glycosyltransferase involved in cell wall biosynthesis
LPVAEVRVREIRVLFVLGSLWAGGSERQVIETLKALDRRRFRPLLYVMYGDGDLRGELPADVPLYCYWERHRFPRFNLPGMIRRRQSLDLAGVLESERVDVVCDRNFEMTLLAAAACYRRPTPRISVISSDPQRDLAENAGRYRAIKRRYLQRAYRAASRVVAVSQGVAAAARDYYGLSAAQLVTIHNFVDPERVADRADEFTPPFDPSRFHLVVNQLVHGRGMRQLMLWIVGRGPLRDELQAQVQAKNLQEHVQLTGFQSNPLPYLKRAQLFCLPSLYEGMPNVLVEAMLCGTPVLASDCPSGPAEILEGGRHGGLVPPGDPSALAEAIADAVTNYAAWQSRTAAARSHAATHYCLRAGVSAIEELLDEVSRLAAG